MTDLHKSAHVAHKCIVLFKVIPIIFQAFQTHHGEQRTSEVSLKEIMHYLSA